jgi:hypothetical protein
MWLFLVVCRFPLTLFAVCSLFSLFTLCKMTRLKKKLDKIQGMSFTIFALMSLLLAVSIAFAVGVYKVYMQ